MRVYHAGSSTHLLHEAGLRRPLVSYADVGSAVFRFWVDAQPAGAQVFLDSGAFTVWRSGKAISVDAYCEYLLEHARRFEAYAALDVIGDWRASADNLEAMRSRGLRPMPVFHRGSPWEELERLARENGSVAIGGMMSLSGQKMHRQTQEFVGPFLDECFRRLLPHWPVKVHAFGLVTQWVLERYPLYSADSATVVLGASLGTYARFQRGHIRWKYWWEDVPVTLDGELGDISGSTKQEAREARYRRSLDSILKLERHVTDLWEARGVSWAA